MLHVENKIQTGTVRTKHAKLSHGFIYDLLRPYRGGNVAWNEACWTKT